MSNDSNYVYQMCVAIVDGVLDPKLSARRIGPMHSARWLTFAGRLLRLYVSGVKMAAINKEHLENTVDFIIRAYFKVLQCKIELEDGCKIRIQSSHSAIIINSRSCLNYNP